jgi:hypothetical protein
MGRALPRIFYRPSPPDVLRVLCACIVWDAGILRHECYNWYFYAIYKKTIYALTQHPDSRAHLPSVNRERNPYLAYANRDVVPDLYDIPIGLVNRACYSSRRPTE